MDGRHFDVEIMPHQQIDAPEDTKIHAPDCFVDLRSEALPEKIPGVAQVSRTDDASALSGTLKPLALMLRNLRFESGLTLDQLAHAIGVSKPTVWGWEKGRCTPTPDKLGAIAKALGVAPHIIGLAAKAERRNLAKKKFTKQLGADRETMLTVGRTIIAEAYDVDLTAVRVWIEV